MITYCLTILLLFWYLKEKQIFTLPLNLSYDKVWPLKPWSLWSKFWTINWRNALNPNSGKHEKSARSASAVAPLQRAHKVEIGRWCNYIFEPANFQPAKSMLEKIIHPKKYRFGAKLRCIQLFEKSYFRNMCPLTKVICICSKRVPSKKRQWHFCTRCYLKLVPWKSEKI